MGQRLIKSIFGGLFIALGGTCFLSVDSKILGAFLFAVGLYAICCTGQLLFTGRASYTGNLPELGTILVGNYIGANLGGLVIRLVRPELFQKALVMCTNKMSLFGWVTFVLAMLCNVFIYIAVEGYKHGQPLLLIMAVAGFILCGFEHSIADMFYFAMAGMYEPINLLFILVVVFGNFSAGQLIRLANKE